MAQERKVRKFRDAKGEKKLRPIWKFPLPKIPIGALQRRAKAIVADKLKAKVKLPFKD